MEPRGFISAGHGDCVKARVPRRLASERLVARAIWVGSMVRNCVL
jgi:hypothetical protein